MEQHNTNKAPGSIEIYSYPGKRTVKSSINRLKCLRVLKILNRLNCGFSEIPEEIEFGLHEIIIVCLGEYKVIVRKNIIITETGNTISVYSDPDGHLEKFVIKEISRTNFKEIIDYKNVSEALYSLSKKIKQDTQYHKQYWKQNEN
ncbi:MAG: hypothetical protein PHN88_08790 [Ignavibacteria bacterium]|nr:hypothetical protein [Ignavibacteria bacterium]